jgi:hypothetical protein
LYLKGQTHGKLFFRFFRALKNEFSNPVAAIEALKRTRLFSVTGTKLIRDSSTSLGMTFVLERVKGSLQQKTRIENSIRVFEILPRRCRSGGSPVPFQ